MARTAVGAITIQDVKDGIHPISLVLSNQSHTFSANQQGVVTDFSGFSCEVFVYVGDTRATYDNANSPEKNTYTITSDAAALNSAQTGGGWEIANNINASTQAVLTITSIPEGSTGLETSYTLPIVVQNAIGTSTPIDAVISLNKIIEGADGALVQLTPSRQTFRFNENDATTDGDVVIPVKTAGNTGALSAYYALNGSASWIDLVQENIWDSAAANNNGGTGVCTVAGVEDHSVAVGDCDITTAGKAKALDIDGSADGLDSITISAANFNATANDVFTVMVSGVDGGSDIVSIIKIQDGNTGPAALTVTISSDNGGFAFKNNAGAAKILTVKVYDNADASVVTPSSFQWRKNGTALTGATQTGLGSQTASYTVTSTDITDNGSEEYSCLVTIT